MGWRTNPGASAAPVPIDLTDGGAGNRFDAVDASFTVVYAAGSRHVALLEAVAPLRPDPRLDQQVAAWGGMGFMLPGSISAEWRNKRVWAEVNLSPRARFLDLHAPSTVAWINEEARAIIAAFDLSELTLGHLTGENRLLTRTLSTWLHHRLLPGGEHQFAGICFGSKHGRGLDCWAIYGRGSPAVRQWGPIRPTDPEVARVEADLGVKFH